MDGERRKEYWPRSQEENIPLYNAAATVRLAIPKLLYPRRNGTLTPKADIRM